MVTEVREKEKKKRNTQQENPYSPLSICAGIFDCVHVPHCRHVSATTLGIRSFSTLSGFVRNCTRKPAETCQAM